MPAYMDPIGSKGQKRKREDDIDVSTMRKRPSAAPPDDGRNQETRYFMVQWRNHQAKKNKTWDDDGIAVINSAQCTVFDTSNNRIVSGRPNVAISQIDLGSEFSIGGKDVYIDSCISQQDYMSGKCFGGAAPDSSSSVLRSSSSVIRPFVPLRPKTVNGFKPPSFVANKPFMSKLSDVAHSESSQQTPEPEIHVAASPNSYWTASWRKPQQRKHKTWEGDAFVMLKKGKLTLLSEKGLIWGSKKWDGTPLESGYSGRIGKREFELDSEISQSELPTITGSAIEHDSDIDLENDDSLDVSIISYSPAPRIPAAQPQVSPPKPQSIPATSFYAHVKAVPKQKGPLHDPTAEGAIVMKAPTKEHAETHNKKNAPIVPVVLDPILARKLRPHQVEGVKFMYECVMGMAHSGKGCILADEMGMGKTLQTITLIWTLLKQNPYGGIGPVIGKAMIVCPVSLVNNWKNEFHKWLGRDRVGVFVGDKDKETIKQFANSRIHKVLIIGYERLRTVIKNLAYCIPPIGLIICDEGHRLKSSSNKTSTMFAELKTPRRIILSGTPIQNDLSEFHAMADFCNPGILGDDYQKFKKVFEVPIMKSRAPDCSAKEKEIGDARLSELMEVARKFVLRRDATILKRYLPPKYEYVVFIAPTKLQRDMFQRILTRDNIDSVSTTHTAESLALINLLTKISNSPILLKATVDQARRKGDAGDIVKKNSIEEALKLLPERAQVEDVSLSGKLAALANLLRAVYKHTEEKCIIVSHYTSTLNIIEAFCKRKGYTYHRLDGQTPAAKRQEYVNEFNKSSQSQRFIFLLSSKAGGVGLNLIGASRLCLIDSDWNPSHDLQSMARIHRDGQKRPVFIYRFLTAGTIDEKIFQRQVTKLGLSNSLMGNGKSDSKSDSFTRKDLRDIFTVHPGSSCHTHELLECPCSGTSAMQHIGEVDSADEGAFSEPEGKGFVNASQVKQSDIEKMDRAYLKQKKAQLASLGEWTHIDCLTSNARERIHDSILHRLLHSMESTKSRPSISGKKSLAESILAATDLHALREETKLPISAFDVPGGTVTFLFERGIRNVSEDVPVPDAVSDELDD
ncbi:hypothetical protein K474DRAFT_1612582 [Panus rudis PR-1116 ss-1]|nr:hypothetical protein K474DRAFT_1612582 [Panus rudis PR-1116 ss-1]